MKRNVTWPSGSSRTTDVQARTCRRVAGGRQVGDRADRGLQRRGARDCDHAPRAPPKRRAPRATRLAFAQRFNKEREAARHGLPVLSWQLGRASGESARRKHAAV